MQTPNITEQNMEQIAKLFPNVMTETQDENGKVQKVIDFDLLKQSLSSVLVDDADERYRLDWPGKKAALLKANTPITKTLRPCREDSVNFDSTENVYIEGDNFEVLKILQESYLGKIKMIYIDPPYNTGKDFIYKDKFMANKADYEEELGVTDNEDNKLFKNTDTNGRFHSDWLSMMYERLIIARDLLKEDGVIFISIDDNEVHNLRGICDDIFGEENFVGKVIWKNVTDNNPTNIAIEHEYIVAYAKSRSSLEPVWKSTLSKAKDILLNIGNELIGKYEEQETLQREYSKWFRENKNQLWPLENYKFIDRQGVYSGERGVHNPGKEGYRYDIIHPTTGKPCKEPLMGYRFPKDTINKMIDEGRIIYGEDENKLVEIKVYAKDYKQKLSSVMSLDGRTGTNELKDLFPETKKIFTNPKTIKLLEELVSFVCNKNDIILDFFSGSGSMAHSVFKLNAEDGRQRQFIMAQLPEETFEVTDGKEFPKSGTAGEAYKAGYKTIAEIGKERIRRAGNKIVADNQDKDGINKLDIGFRVYKTDSSNMKEVHYHPEQLKQDDLFKVVDNTKDGRTPDDFLTQVILDLGLELNLPIEQKDMHGNKVFIVQTNALVACFDDNINVKIIDEIAQLKPFKVVFKDASFADSKDRINLEERFKRLSPETLITVI